MKIIHYILCLLLFGNGVFVNGQNHYLFSSFTSNDGLPSTKTYSTFQDSRGYIWVASHAGLSRYDGQGFKNYSLVDGLSSPLVFKVAEDADRNLWLSTENGCNTFDGKKFTRIAGLDEKGKNIAFIGDTAFVSSKNGLYKLYGNRAIDSLGTAEGLLSNKVTTIKNSGNKLYIGTSKGINIYENGLISEFWRSTDDSYIMSIAEDHQSAIWFCTLSGKVFYHKNGNFNQLQHAESGKHNTFKLLVNQEGDVVLMHGQYLSVYRDAKLRYIIDGYIGHKENVVVDVMEDREGNLWLSSIYGLIVGRKTKIKKINFPRNSITNVFISDFDKELYAVGYKNIYKLRGDTIFSEVFEDKPEQLGELNFVTEHRKGEFLFAASIGGLILYKNHEYKLLTKGFSHVNSYKLIDDDIWILHKNKISLLVGDSLQECEIELPDEQLLFFDIDKISEGEYLLSTNNGLVKYNKKEAKLLKSAGWIANRVFFKKLVRNTDSSFFVATKGYGLLNVSIKGDSMLINYSINSRNSYINDDIVDFVIDEKENIWLTTSAGLYKIYNVHTGDQLVEFIGREEGMPSHSWSFSCLLNDKKGNMYVSGSEGVAKIPLDITSNSPVVQNTQITGIDVGGKAFQWNMPDSLLNFEGLPASYEFEHQQNALTFHFSGLNFYKPQKVIYQYQLQGLEKNWNMSSNSFASYNNLPPGYYTFKLRSSTNLQSMEYEPISQFAFVIAPPIWQSWWFQLLSILTFGILIYSFYRYRLNEQINKQKLQLEISRQLTESKMLAFQARMNPHFVFNSLNSIQYFITNNDKVSTLTYLSKFAKLLRQIVDNSIQPKLSLDVELDMLASYIEMEELRFDKKFSFKIIVDRELEPSDIEIPSMILQPFVENSIIHGLLHIKKAGKLHIQIQKGHRQIICTIEDNGIGRKKSEELNRQKHKNHQSQGTKIAINRLELLSDREEGVENTVEFVDLYTNGKPSGTKVILKIPIL